MKTFLFLAAGALALLGAATPHALAEQPVRIGASLALTGPASSLGDPAKKTLDMLTERLNAEGGLLGREVRLIVYDDGGDAQKAVTNINRLVSSDDIDVVIGPSTTGTTMAVLPLAARAQTPMISLAGGITIVDPVQKWVFKTPHSDRMVCQRIFENIKATGGARVAMISGTGGFGRSMRDQCMAVAQDFGIAIVADESYGPQDNDMTVQLTRIRDTQGVDAVVNAGFGAGPAIVTRNYRQLGLTTPLYQSHGVASKKFIELAGDSAEGVRLPAAAAVAPEVLPQRHVLRGVLQAYKAAYEQRWKEPVSAFGANAYDGFWLYVNAVRAAGTTDKAAVRDALEKTTGWAGANGVFTMTAQDHNGLDYSSLVLLEIRDGDWTLVE